jgi:hypothetical protein
MKRALLGFDIAVAGLRMQLRVAVQNTLTKPQQHSPYNYENLLSIQS